MKKGDTFGKNRRMFYVGIHKGNNPNYMGSGKRLKRAQKELGMDRFTMRIVYRHPDYEAVRKMEKKIVDIKFLARDDVYNEAVGGGNTNLGRKVAKRTLETRLKMSKARKGKKWSPERRKRMIERLKAAGKNVPCTIDGISYETVAGASAALGIHYDTIMFRLRSINFSNYHSPKIEKIPPGKFCTINGITYRNTFVASKKLGMSRQTIRNRIVNPNFPNYRFAQTTDEAKPRATKRKKLTDYQR